jgi:hypothetical protein
MVDGIDGLGGSRPVGPRKTPLDAQMDRVRVRRRDAKGRNATGRDATGRDATGRDATGRDAQNPSSTPEQPRYPGKPYANPYAKSGGERHAGSDPDVVLSRSAAILVDGNLADVLRRSAMAIRRLAVSLLDIPEAQTESLIEVFEKEAFGWVQQALSQYHAYSDHHDHLPIGISFEDVRISMDPAISALEVEVGGIHFRDAFPFRANGVVFDVRGTEAVHKPAPGFFVDTGEHGAGIADDIIERVRADLPQFGGDADTGGVAVLIRSDASAYSRDRASAYRVDFDVLVPFDPNWTG